LLQDHQEEEKLAAYLRSLGINPGENGSHTRLWGITAARGDEQLIGDLVYYKNFMDIHHIHLAPLEQAIIMLVRRIGARGVIALITIASIILSVLATLALVIPQFSLEYSNDLILTVSLIIAVTIPLLVAPITVGLCINLLVRLDEAYVNLLKLSITDSLTGATNRRGFFAEATARVQGLNNNDSAFVGMVDLDSFKILNDSFGHQFGDKVLCAVVQRLQLVLGDDIVGRLGGDEFAFLITGSLSRNRQVIQEIRTQCNIFPLDIEGNGKPILVSSSIGIVPWDRQESLDQALARADDALYTEKDFSRASDSHNSSKLRARDH
jgi:diguanylate cyclase (GGDEF)-like protein